MVAAAAAGCRRERGETLQLVVEERQERASRHHLGVRIRQGFAARTPGARAEAFGAGAERHDSNLVFTPIVGVVVRDGEPGEQSVLVRLRLAVLGQRGIRTQHRVLNRGASSHTPGRWGCRQ